MDDTETPNQIDQDLQELETLIAETEKELAAGKGWPGKPSRLSVAKISYLVGVAKDVLETLHQKTNGAREAKFVANIVKAAIDYWHPGEVKEPHGRG